MFMRGVLYIMEGLTQPKEGFMSGERGQGGQNIASFTHKVEEVMLHKSSVA